MSNLKLSHVAANDFSVTWDKAYTPEGFPLEVYNITVVNQDGLILQHGSVDAASKRLNYSYTYTGSNHPDYPMCSRLVFSVVAVANGKSSLGANVSWSGPEKGETYSCMFAVGCACFLLCFWEL